MAGLLSWHRAGQKVACIDDTPVPNPLFDKLTLDRVYTIDKVHVPPEPYASHIGFRLVETAHPGFYGHRLFRPVYPQIIEQLRKLDAPIKQRETERV